MPAAVASRAREHAKKSRTSRDAALPPAKKTKLSPPTSTPHQDSFKALLNGVAGTKPAVTAKINGVKNPRHARVNEHAAVVRGGPAGHGDVDMVDSPKEVIEISSAEESSDYSSSDDEAEHETGAGAQEEAVATDAIPVANGQDDDADDRPGEDGTAEPEEPSFGERLQHHEPEPSPVTRVVDVEAAFEDPSAGPGALAPVKPHALAAPSTASLGTVLTQALRTNDKDLLDSCLRINDVDTIYATVERLPSPLVGNLLQKLAERLYRKPGRAGMLMVWVQWSLAAHGGYLASQPQLVRQLATLNKVLKERASGLQPLLSLKGRLDMLQAQLELRKRNQRKDQDNEEEAVIYVEGEDDESSADEDDTSSEEGDAQSSAMRKMASGTGDDDDEASSIDQMPTTMEVDEDSDEGSEDSEDMLDDEAEETDNDTGDDMSEPMSDDDGFIDDGEDVSGSEEESKPVRRSTAARAQRF
ncbi:NUC189-domain-containing protein [Lophiostoma macrostomum CBS 122681]|uniref:NUC189-domain-containing protein n=1 Tax=Lophiostoma macrostomum CBS 122681 TaxID=1314788 RepID=A0A6A6TEL3_9PLEO|nr:NUC189-domain-containing protein [Lophiostoma macrostomum CBS 122681]